MTTSQATATAPDAQRDTSRLHGLDLARGLAMLGMFVAHTAAAGPYAQGTWLGTVLGWSHGRSSILFALLAGVSLGILTGRTRPYTGEAAVHARIRVLVRGVVLLAVTGFLAVLDGQVIVILAYYSAWFFLALPFAWWHPRRLFALAAVVAVLGPPLRWALSAAFPPLLLVLDTYDINDFFVEALVSGGYPGLTYMVFVFVGLGLARLDLGAVAVELRLVAIGVGLAVVGYLGGLAASGALGLDALAPVELPEYDETLVPAADLVAIWPHSGSTFEILGSGGVALAVTGLCLLVPDVAARTVLAPLAAVGAMSLTAYSAHVVVLALIPTMVAADSAVPAVVLVIGSLALCWAWRAGVGRGPLELLMYVTSHRATRPPSPPG